MTATISNLPPISAPLQTNDLFLVRRGTTDYQAAANIVQSVNVEELGQVISYAPNDLMMIWNLGNSTLSKINFDQVGFLKETQMWFFSTAPSNWECIPGTGDKVLGCSDTNTPNVNYNGKQSNKFGGSVIGGEGGHWQQFPVNPNPVSAFYGTPPDPSRPRWGWYKVDSPGGNGSGGMQASQIPALIGQSNGVDNDTLGNSARYGFGPSSQKITCEVNSSTSENPTGLPHDHSDNWRPKANVGTLCIKLT